jgi:hypothetical protein
MLVSLMLAGTQHHAHRPTHAANRCRAYTAGGEQQDTAQCSESCTAGIKSHHHTRHWHMQRVAAACTCVLLLLVQDSYCLRVGHVKYS